MASHKKASDEDIAGLNSVGLSLGGIAKRLGIHHTTVTMRLKELGIPPADTRRAFMEDIYDNLTIDQQDWLKEQLSGGRSIKDFVRGLLIKSYIGKKP